MFCNTHMDMLHMCNYSMNRNVWPFIVQVRVHQTELVLK